MKIDTDGDFFYTEEDFLVGKGTVFTHEYGIVHCTVLCMPSILIRIE